MLSLSQNSKDFFLLKYQQAFHVMINSLIFQLNAQIQYP